MKKNPKISIIVPVYNVEQYLPRCIDSILNQSFADFELLLIDDGSRDKSGAICDEYAAKDSRIRVFHKENGGVSSARNLGLDNACGEWLAFVDSDDIIKENYLKHMVDRIKCSNQLIMSCSDYIDNTAFRRMINQDAKFQDVFGSLIKQGTISHTQPWSKLYNKEVVNKNSIRFPINVHMDEDGIFMFHYLLYVECISYVDSVDYIYDNSNTGSLMTKLNPFESEFTGLKLLHEMAQKLLNKYNITVDRGQIVWNQCQMGSLYLRCLQSACIKEKYAYGKQCCRLLFDFGIDGFADYYLPKRKLSSILHMISKNKVFKKSYLLYKGLFYVSSIMRKVSTQIRAIF